MFDFNSLVLTEMFYPRTLTRQFNRSFASSGVVENSPVHSLVYRVSRDKSRLVVTGLHPFSVYSVTVASAARSDQASLPTAGLKVGKHNIYYMPR